jgi:hypothetical protein
VTVTLKEDVSDPAGLVALTTYVPECISGVSTPASVKVDIPGGTFRFVLTMLKPFTWSISIAPFLVHDMSDSAISRLNSVILTVSIRGIPTSTSTSKVSGVRVGPTVKKIHTLYILEVCRYTAYPLVRL